MLENETVTLGSEPAVENITGTAFEPSTPPTLKAALDASQQTNSKRVFDSYAIAQDLGRTTPLVHDFFEQNMLDFQTKRIASNNSLAEWAARGAQEAAIAREHFTEMDRVFTSMSSWREMFKRSEAWQDTLKNGGVVDEITGVPKSVVKTAGRLIPTTAESTYQLVAMGAGFVDIMEESVAATLKRMGITQSQRTAIFGSVRDYFLQNAEDVRKTWLQNEYLTLPKELQGRLLDNPEYLLSPEYLTFQAGEAANSLAAMFLGSKGLNVIGKSMGVVPSIGGTSARSMGAVGGAMEAGAFYHDLIKDGVANEDALSASIAFGAVTGVLNRLGLERILKGSSGKGFMQGMRNFLIAGSAEGLTEYLENPFQAIIESLVKGEDADKMTARFLDSLKDVDVIPGAFLAGGGIRASNARARRASEFAHGTVTMKGAVDATPVQASSPEMMREILENEGVEGSLYIPAENLLQLYQTDPALSEALGIRAEDIQTYAAMGQDVPVQVSSVLTALDTTQFTALAEMAREAPESMNGVEAVSDTRLEEDTEALRREWRNLQDAQDAYEQEISSFRKNLVRVAEETPGLVTQAEDAGHFAEIIDGAARRFYPEVQDRLAFLRRVQFRSEQDRKLDSDPLGQMDYIRALEEQGYTADELMLPPQEEPLPDLESLGEMYTPEEYERLVAQQALMDELGITPDMSRSQQARRLSPTLNHIWGRLDGKSLRQDYPGAYKDLTRKYGIGLFNKNGQAIDTLADELVRSGLLPEGSGANELVTALQDRRQFFQNDSIVLGSVPQGLAAILPLGKDGQITLNQDSLAHIEKNHGKEIRSAGFPDVRAFILHVLSRVDAIYPGRTNRSFDFVNKEGKPFGRVLGRLEFVEAGGDYQITTAGPIRADYYKNKKPLWEGAQSNQSENGPSGAITSHSDSFLNLTTQETDVNDTGSVETFFHSGVKEKLGVITFNSQGATVDLLRNANLSTIVHESAHLFREEMENLRRSGLADEAMLQDMQVLDEWLTRFDDNATLEAAYKKGLRKSLGLGNKKFSKLSDAEKAQVKESAKHEYFARGFEAYMLEGNSPTEKLSSVFKRFKIWLINIYRDAARLDVELTDEVRSVFDRMIASEVEIERSAIKNELVALTQQELDKLGARGAERRYQEILLEAAKNKAVEKLQAEKDRGRKQRIKDWEKQARETLIQNPAYQVRSEIVSSGQHLDLGMMRVMFGDETIRTIRRNVGPGAVRESGQDPTLLAARYGFDGAAQMVSVITTVPGLKKSVKEIVQARESEWDSSLNPADFLLDTDEIARNVELVGEWLARNLGKEALQQRAFRLFAGEQLRNTKMREARLENQYLAAMRRALRKERMAIGKGDFETALKANTQARLNMEMARQGKEIARQFDRVTNQAKRFIGRAKSDPAARYFVNDIAARFGLMPYNERLGDGKDADTIVKWINAMKEDGFGLYFDEFVLRSQTNWRDITVEQFQGVSDSIEQIVSVERNARKMLTEQGKADFAERIKEATDTTYTHRAAKLIKTIDEGSLVGNSLQLTHAAHTKIEALLVAMDGGKLLGKNWSLVYKPINDAENRRGVMFKELSDRLKSKAMFGAYTDRELLDMFRIKEAVPGIVGEMMTRGQRIMVALNMGNEGNYSRLIEGRGWESAQVEEVVSGLDERDWNFVRAVWDVFESYKTDAFDLHEQVTGIRPKAVEARSFMTRYGEIQGGYFPVVYDKKHAKVDFQEKLLSNVSPAFAMTRHGHLEERNEHGAGTPIDLSMSVISSRLNDVITDLCFRKAYIDVGRVLRSDEYIDSIKSTVGHEQYMAMVSWLKDAAKINVQQTVFDPFLRWGRTAATAVAMGFKATTIVTQPFGFTQSIERLGYTDAMKGVAMAYSGGPKKTAEVYAWVKQVSPFMAQRIKSFDRDIFEATSHFARKSLAPDTLISEMTTKIGLHKFEKWMKEKAFVPMGVVQMGVDLPTWLGGYQKALRENGGNEKLAAEYADSVVRLSQGSGQNKDLSSIQRGSEAMKAFTMFYSYFNTLYNLTGLRVADVREHRDAASVIRAANAALLLYVIPAVFTGWAVGRGPDDDEEWLTWSAKQLAAYPFDTVVFLRTFAGVIDAEYGYKASPSRDPSTAVYNFIISVNKAITDEDNKVDGKKLARGGFKAAAYLSGLPLGQAEITLFNIIDFMDGTTEDFQLRDLFYRKQKDRLK